MLFIGEKVGNNKSNLQFDIALDPLEGTTITAYDNYPSGWFGYDYYWEYKFLSLEEEESTSLELEVDSSLLEEEPEVNMLRRIEPYDCYASSTFSDSHSCHNLTNNDYTGWKIKDIKAVDKKNQNFQFLDKKTKIIKNLNFDEKNDFIIFPEIFAHFAEELCSKKKVKYAIMVLNSFSVFPTNDSKKLNRCYRNAEFIISGSKIITKYIKFTFPKILISKNVCYWHFFGSSFQ